MREILGNTKWKKGIEKERVTYTGGGVKKGEGESEETERYAKG